MNLNYKLPTYIIHVLCRKAFIISPKHKKRTDIYLHPYHAILQTFDCWKENRFEWFESLL